MTAPALTSELQQEADIGPYHWPPIPNSGCVLVSLETEIEKDTQKPNGKDPIQTKIKGKKAAQLTFEFTFTRAAEKEGNAIRLALDPHGPNSGKAWDVRTPEANARGVDHVIFYKASKLNIRGDVYSFTLHAEGWKEPQKAAVGGTTTPKKAVPADAKITVGQGGDLPGYVLPLGEIQPGGFDGPNAPDAEP